MKRDAVAIAILFAALISVLALPFLMKREAEQSAHGARTLVILSPHNEAIRFEFELAFRRWHRELYGEDVDIDWRNIGGTSEIVRYIDASFEAAERAGADGIGVDLLFGGGQYDHSRQAGKGQLEACGFKERHPEWLSESIIPASFSGEQFYDSEDRWYGCCLAEFGICCNVELLADRGITNALESWQDLADYRLFGLVALADPTKSGSINKAFELLIQDRILAELSETEPATSSDLTAGWADAINLIRMIGANTRYFTDAAGKVPFDVAQGNAAAGMCIDFYGRFESETVARNEGSDRMKYLTPRGGSSASVDPIAMLKGAPHRETAERFIDFCLGLDGQRLWNYKVGEPGGPDRYALRRMPVRRDLYTEQHLSRMSDPDALPYERSAKFIYKSEWTSSLFQLIQLLVRALCIDTHEELTSAWRAIHEAGGPDEQAKAAQAFATLPASAEYEAALSETANRIRDPLERVRVLKEWTLFARRQYKEAEQIATRHEAASADSTRERRMK